MNEQKIAERAAVRINKCAVCGVFGQPGNIAVVPVGGGDQLAIGICSSCAKLTPAELAKVVYGLVEVYQTRASHLQLNPN